MKNLIFILLFFALSTNLFSEPISGHKTRPSTEQVKKDFDAQNFDAYSDNFSVIQAAALVEKGIITDIAKLENNTTVNSVEQVSSLLNCDVGTNTHFTSTIYDIDIESGSLTCLVANTSDINNPLGIFNISYPTVAEFFSKDLEEAKSENISQIEQAETTFQLIADEKQAIKDSVFGSGEGHMSIPDLVMAVILTDDSKIDVAATNDNNKIILKNGLSSSIIVDGEVTDVNGEYVMSDLSTLFVNYAKLSDITFNYVLVLVGFLAVFGFGHRLADHYRNKNREQNENVLYAGGIVIAAMLFMPITQDEQIVNEYSTFTNKFQSFERDGYGLFAGMSDDIAEAIVDTQIDSIIAKSGIGTADGIINSYAGMNKYVKMHEFAELVDENCRQIYDYDGALQETDINNNNKAIYTNNSSTLFPTSENWAYAEALYNGKNNYYALVTNDGSDSIAYSSTAQNAYNNITTDKSSLGATFFPQMSLAACGKNYFKNYSYDEKFKTYETTYNAASQADENENAKAIIIKQLVTFQYTLLRDFGFLAILGLPVVEMQTEQIGSIYEEKSNEAIEILEAKMSSDDDGSSIFHSMFSTLPYMMVPGAMPVYDIVSSTSEKIFQKGSTAALSWVPFAGDSLAAAGGLIGTVTAQNAGFGAGYMVAKSVLSSLPIVGIILLGLLRFIIIIVKIFVLHFASLFILPMAFFKGGVSRIGRFGIKIFSIMIELPMFVLAVYLALVAHSLVQNVSTLFTKNIVAGMIENSDSLHTLTEFSVANFVDLNFSVTDTIQIYMMDGLFEVVTALFSIFIIYKIIISMHTLFFESIEMKSTESFDNLVETIKNDAANMGGKI